MNSFKQSLPSVNGIQRKIASESLLSEATEPSDLIVIPNYASVQVTMEDRHIIHTVIACWVLEEGGLEELMLTQQINHIGRLWLTGETTLKRGS